jgi:hypothetical protein
MGTYSDIYRYVHVHSLVYRHAFLFYWTDIKSMTPQSTANPNQNFC